MSPTSCRCSTPRRTGACRPGSRVSVSVSARGPRVVSRGPGAPAAASPPVGSPPQYSPALRWVTTGFGMGPGGASALSATGAPDPPLPGRATGGASLSRRVVVVVVVCLERAGGGWFPPRPRARPGIVPGGLRRAVGSSERRVCVSVGGPARVGGRGAAPGWWGDRPRPSARLGSGRLPAVHPPPVNPVVSRGPYP